jgi:hypothetical protein
MVVNLKLWWVQDWLYSLQRPDIEDKEKTWEQLMKLKDLNLQRNRLIEEIDEVLNQSIRRGEAPIIRSNKCLGNSTKTQ